MVTGGVVGTERENWRKWLSHSSMYSLDGKTRR
ncbi:hypothetical protein GDO86_020458 [Hymenochirus boettgeri]|uniref:Uncharacterized protein n=1 Tax=Hymenochirus boettgeri TaxID=247094 RepID=A0A8T2IF80_9PIPI|nr:hypothetical protein GDO86_020458 [Hymenochirus boettgeri]